MPDETPTIGDIEPIEIGRIFPIALGIVATSLKILLGLDRPYLGKD